MKIIVAVDDNNGVLFNHRRLSKDRELKKRILDIVNASSSRLFITSFSEKLFADEIDDWENEIVVDDDMLQHASDEDYCFIEDADVGDHFENIHEIILYRWNREYPADTFFYFPEEDYQQISENEFSGYSHDTITEERWIRQSEGEWWYE